MERAHIDPAEPVRLKGGGEVSGCVSIEGAGQKTSRGYVSLSHKVSETMNEGRRLAGTRDGKDDRWSRAMPDDGPLFGRQGVRSDHCIVEGELR